MDFLLCLLSFQALPSYDQLLAKPKHHKCQTCADQMAAVVLGTGNMYSLSYWKYLHQS